MRYWEIVKELYSFGFIKDCFIELFYDSIVPLKDVVVGILIFMFRVVCYPFGFIVALLVLYSIKIRQKDIDKRHKDVAEAYSFNTNRKLRDSTKGN